MVATTSASGSTATVVVVLGAVVVAGAVVVLGAVVVAVPIVVVGTTVDVGTVKSEPLPQAETVSMIVRYMAGALMV